VIWHGRLAKYFCLPALVALATTCAAAPDFKFDRDTLAFANSTVFDYQDGKVAASPGKSEGDQLRAYTRRCFVMSRTVLQFHKFARFDPRSAPLDDKTLVARVRTLTRLHPWQPAMPENERIVFPGYANLRTLSKARPRVLQENLGLGWPTYARIGNFRMFFRRDDDKYQEETQKNLDAALAGEGFFVAYLSDYPHFRINHAVLVYARKPVRSPKGIQRYVAYDPNHPDAPRELKWSPSMRIFNYQKDEEFVGGYTRVYQVYGKPWQ
jgi:hypothetical protein